MAIVGTIDGIPLFTTAQEALSWAASNNLSGYHTHNYNGQTSYMGGTTHAQATKPSTPPTQSSNSGGGY